jgi:hypothetical protein
MLLNAFEELSFPGTQGDTFATDNPNPRKNPEFA